MLKHGAVLVCTLKYPSAITIDARRVGDVETSAGKTEIGISQLNHRTVGNIPRVFLLRERGFSKTPNSRARTAQVNGESVSESTRPTKHLAVKTTSQQHPLKQ